MMVSLQTQARKLNPNSADVSVNTGSLTNAGADSSDSMSTDDEFHSDGSPAGSLNQSNNKQ